MLVATGIGTFEPVAGELYDAAEHYGNASGMEQATGSVGFCLVDSDGRDFSQHIKGFDHCGHAHGSALRCDLLPVAAIVAVPAPYQPAATVPHADAPSLELYHPPKA